MSSASAHAGPGAPADADAAADRFCTAGPSIGLLTATTLALLRACARYWPAVAAQAHIQLTRCERAAQAIPDAGLRTLALAKLHRERFNPQLAATVATLAPRGRRMLVTRATVCLQVAYDYLDLLTERPGMSTEQARRLLAALAAAAAGDPWWAGAADLDDGGYLRALLAPVRHALGSLPAAAAVREPAMRSAERCAEAQALSHCATDEEVQSFAQRQAATQPLRAMGWQEALAAATASVLCLHALIAAAADPRTTPAHAAELESLYSSIGALAMLDSLLDCQEDRRSGQRGYLERYPAGSQEMADRLAAVIRAALSEGARMRGGAHHLMTLAGLLAYYCSALGSTGAAEQVLRARMHAELGPLLSAPMAVMRGWRAARAGHRAAPCIVSRSQLSAPRPVPACSGGSRETEVPGFDGKPLGEVGS